MSFQIPAGLSSRPKKASRGRGFSESLRALGSKGVVRGFGLSFAWAAPQGAIRMASYETSKAAELVTCRLEETIWVNR